MDLGAAEFEARAFSFSPAWNELNIQRHCAAPGQVAGERNAEALGFRWAGSPELGLREQAESPDLLLGPAVLSHRYDGLDRLTILGRLESRDVDHDARRLGRRAAFGGRHRDYDCRFIYRGKQRVALGMCCTRQRQCDNQRRARASHP
jgi:hypothetical protein